MEPSIKILLDERRKKVDGNYPVKIRIIHNRVVRYYPTEINLTQEQFQDVFSARPSRSLKDTFFDLTNQLNEAVNVVKNMKIFSFEEFEKKRSLQYGGTADAFSYYNRYITDLKKDERIGTADSYRLSMKSIQNFLKDAKKNDCALPFYAITVNWLKEYERFMLKSEKSNNTIGIYLRALRSIYNLAIDAGDAAKDLYPFGHRKYQIPAGRKAKKALDKNLLKIIFEAELELGSPQEKARDIWFLSFACNGINLKDLAELKWENMDDDRIIFVRQKTKLTTRNDQKEIVAYRTPFINSIIEKHSIRSTNKQDYVFGFIKRSMTVEEKWNATKNLVRLINQHIKLLAKSLGITDKISYNWARHSFTTIAIRNGASLEMVQESLGHQNIKTTQTYWAGFDNAAKKSISDNLMNFD